MLTFSATTAGPRPHRHSLLWWLREGHCCRGVISIWFLTYRASFAENLDELSKPMWVKRKHPRKREGACKEKDFEIVHSFVCHTMSNLWIYMGLITWHPQNHVRTMKSTPNTFKPTWLGYSTCTGTYSEYVYPKIALFCNSLWESASLLLTSFGSPIGGGMLLFDIGWLCKFFPRSFGEELWSSKKCHE